MARPGDTSPAASEKNFGRVLDRQFAVDHSRASYGTDGLFAGGLTIGLPGPGPAAAPPTRPQYQMHTLTVTGNYRDGRPDTGDLVLLANVDNSGRLDFIDSMAAFFHGIAKFSVPAGHYFAIGFFFGSAAGGVPFPTTHGLDVAPQFTVAGNTRLRLNERTASSRITMVTPRPASVRDTAFVIFRRPRTGPLQSFGFANFRWLGGNAPIWVSPTGKASKRPSIGSMATVVDQRLAGPARAAPYEYDLAYQNLTGRIPSQRYVVRAASLAVIKARYYLARHGGFLSRVSNFPIQQGSLAFSYDPANVPGTRTIYSSAGPDLIWITSLYTAAGRYPGTLIQTDPARIYRSGQQVTENWNAYPLHPTPNVDVIGSGGEFGTLPSASRSGNTLSLDFTPFGDNTPGHVGAGFSNQSGTSKTTGTYEVDQNGKKISAGDAMAAAGGAPDLRLNVPLSPARSTIKFSLTAALGGRNSAGTPSDQSQTTWTWVSTHESGHHLPVGWFCPDLEPSCRAEPLLTLGYSIPDLSAHGLTRPGRQLINLTVGHLQLVKAAKITRATVQVSIDDGRTWHSAKAKATGAGRFRAALHRARRCLGNAPRPRAGRSRCHHHRDHHPRLPSRSARPGGGARRAVVGAKGGLPGREGRPDALLRPLHPPAEGRRRDGSRNTNYPEGLGSGRP